MTILQIDTYNRNIFEAAMIFTNESLDDRTEFSTLPPDLAEMCKAHVASGAAPATRQPTDSFVVTDEHVIVTFTWNDLAVAQQWSADKLTRNVMGLVSSVVVVSD